MPKQPNTPDVIWLLQTNCLDANQVRELFDAVKSQGDAFIEAVVWPFVDEVDIHGQPSSSRVIPMGSSKLTRIVQNNGWLGAFFDPETFDTRAWVKNRTDMLNADILSTSFQTLGEDFRYPDPRREYFLRPCKDLKAFSGLVMQACDIVNWAEEICGTETQLKPETEISIAPYQHISAEWRHFVVDGRVVTSAMYMRDGQMHVENEQDTQVIREAQRMADAWLPNSSVVMDVALLADGSVKVIEFNCINSSGFYKHDVSALVQALSHQVRNLSDHA